MAVKGTIAYRVPSGTDHLEEMVRFYDSAKEAAWAASSDGTAFLKRAHETPGSPTTFSWAKLVPLGDIRASRLRVARDNGSTIETLAVARENRVVSHETTQTVTSYGQPVLGYTVPLDHRCLLASKNSLRIVVRTGGGSLLVLDTDAGEILYANSCNAPIFEVYEFPFDVVLPLSSAGHTISVQFVAGMFEALNWLQVTYPDGSAP